MKIGLFGNTANALLFLAQAIQRMGHEVLLIVNRKELLYRPESRYPEYYEGYPEWIVDGSQFSEWDYLSLDPKIAPVLEVLSGCDALILNDLGPSLLPLLQRPAISVLTGWDLTYYADFQPVDIRFGQSSQTYETMLGKHLFTDFVQRQRNGIRLSAAVNYFPSGIESRGDELLAEIGVPDSKRIFQFTADLEGINPSPQPNNERVRVYCPVRITWKLPIEPGRSALDYKGSDIMIRGLGLFHRRTGIKLDIVLMRKGLHIADLELLIMEENIAEQVTWLDEMSLTAFRKEISLSDIILEQFGGSMVGGVGMEAMASGRPVIGNLRPEILGDSMPVCQARTPEEICAQLERLVFDPQERERVGKAGREYVEKHANIDEFARKCLSYLEVSLSNQNKTMLSPYTGLSYYLQQQRHLLYEEMARQEAREVELLDYLKLYTSPSVKVLKRVVLEKPYQQEIGFSWAIRLEKLKLSADDGEHLSRSALLLYEDDKLLQPAHAMHEDIRNLGAGRHSHWKDMLYFSTSDGSDPNTNGRTYQIVFAESAD
jgi:glycosyltransferase involved in cell wall biosynthesis